MLKSLEIKNYALIQNFKIDFDEGLHIITGETGAGKSILLGALGLIMGKRADSKVLYDPNQKCYVEAKFQSSNPEINTILKTNELEIEDEIIVRREISTNGKSRAFVNDSPATLDLLQSLTEYLIDIHQQFDTLSFHKTANQMDAINALSIDAVELNNYKQDYSQLKFLLKKIEELKSQAHKNKQELDYFQFQLKELGEAKLNDPLEQEDLEKSLEKLSNAETIKQVFSKINIALYENDQAISNTLTQINRELNNIKDIDHAYASIHQRISTVIEEIKDIANESSNFSESVEFDKVAVEQIQERLSLFYKLQKKHNTTDIKSLLEIQYDLENKVKNTLGQDSEIISLENEASVLSQKLNKKADHFSEKRKNVLISFEKKVNEKLAQLSMPNAKFKVDLKSQTELNENGKDQINFMFAPNKGSDYLPIKDVASGGEIARLTLCIKSVLADKMSMPTMIFDEIDTGVSGEVANKMGEILKQLSHKHQIIAITHSPQVAGKADVHYFVYKLDEKDRTISKIKTLNNEERIIEIAKMLSGANPGKAAIDNAKELIML